MCSKRAWTYDKKVKDKKDTRNSRENGAGEIRFIKIRE